MGKGVVVRGAVVLVLAYALAYAETFAMATEVMEGYFGYEDRGWMLRVGSWGYAVYFLVGLPMVGRIDGDGVWGVERVVVEAAATCGGVMLLLEVWVFVMIRG